MSSSSSHGRGILLQLPLDIALLSTQLGRQVSGIGRLGEQRDGRLSRDFRARGLGGVGGGLLLLGLFGKEVASAGDVARGLRLKRVRYGRCGVG